MRCLLVRQSRNEGKAEATNKKKGGYTSYFLYLRSGWLAMGSDFRRDFRCSVGTVKSVGLEDHNKKGRAARYGEARRWWDLNDDTGASRCERIFE